ncbi:MAG: DUF58 domain-containing protein [Pseudomonadota bacterium]|nr:DUF58 domain-containing protein [Pseudomonadota bacterium]
MPGLSRLDRLILGWVAHRHPRQAGVITLRRQRIYILPTRYGVLFGIMLLVMLLGAMNYGNSMAFATCFLLGALAFVAMHHTHQNLLGLRIWSIGAEPVFASERAYFRLFLENPNDFMRYSISVEGPNGDTQHVHVPPHERAQVRIGVDSTCRGYLKAPRFRISTEHPLGLFRAWSFVQPDTDSLVYPAPAESPPTVNSATHGYGRNPSRRIGSSEDFHSLRDYHHGDPFRHILWTALAREQGLLTKQFSASAGHEIWLDLSALETRDVELGLSQLCRLLLECERDERPYGLKLSSGQRSPSLGSDHREACLRMLALHNLPRTGMDE